MSVSIPDGLVVLTFDDGVKSQYTFAAPILCECGFNATFYVTEGLNFLTDKTRYLTWEEVRELHDLGFEIGNHTRQHKSVANQSGEELLSDIRHIDRPVQSLRHTDSHHILLPRLYQYSRSR